MKLKHNSMAYDNVLAASLGGCTEEEVPLGRYNRRSVRLQYYSCSHLPCRALQCHSKAAISVRWYYIRSPFQSEKDNYFLLESTHKLILFTQTTFVIAGSCCWRTTDSALDDTTSHANLQLRAVVAAQDVMSCDTAKVRLDYLTFRLNLSIQWNILITQFLIKTT